jgi:type IV pilus assembly protein PilY1
VDQDGDVDSGDGDRVIVVCGMRKGGRSYFALDVTNPDSPELLWRISQKDDARAGRLKLTSVNGTFQDNEALAGNSAGAAVTDGTLDGDLLGFDAMTASFTVGETVTGGTSGATGVVAALTPYAPSGAGPDHTIAQLGETWSEPACGKIKTADGDTTGTEVFFMGGGYTADNSSGKTVLAVNVLTGAVVRQAVGITGMNYAFPSGVRALDVDGDGFVDKVYVGDTGSQLWRFGWFKASNNDPIPFPGADENINHWTAQILFLADSTHARAFFYPPAVTLEKGYDLVFAATGNREDACTTSGPVNRIYAVRDKHLSTAYAETDLVNVTDVTSTTPNLDSESDVDASGNTDQGWYITLDTGEKVLAEGTVFAKVLYVTTFMPNNEPCVPGGAGTLYAVNWKTGQPIFNFDTDEALERSKTIGGGIPSKPVTVITDTGTKMFISVGSTNPDDSSGSVGAGILSVDPEFPAVNFFYLWWKEL